MSTENLNKETTATQAENKGEANKTFTQEQVNAIVTDRLARDRQKQNEELSKREQELAEREFRLNSRQKLIEKGLPEDMLDVLNCSSEDAFNKALDKLEAFIKERTPSPEQKEIEQKKAKFTSRMDGVREGAWSDPIKKAMNLK